MVFCKSKFFNCVSQLLWSTSNYTVPLNLSLLSANVLCCLHVGMSTSAFRALTSALHPSSHLILLISWFCPPTDTIFAQGGWLWLCREENVLTLESPAKKVCSDWSSPFAIMFLNRRQLEKFSMELEQPSMLVGQTSFPVRTHSIHEVRKKYDQNLLTII